MVGNNSNLEIFNRIKETNSNNADEYSNSKTYAKDEYCIYNNTLYKANQAIDTAEEFTESHWTETTVGTELKSQADSISALNSSLAFNTAILDVGITAIYNAYMVTIIFSAGTSTYNAGEWNTIAEIPENIRPDTVVTFAALNNETRSDADNTPVWARVTTDGHLQIYAYSDRAEINPIGSVSYAIS